MGFLAFALTLPAQTAVATPPVAVTPVIIDPSAPSADTLPDTYATAGLFFNSYTQPHISGYGAYAKRLTGSTYSYTVADVTRTPTTNGKPEISTTSGVAQYLKNFGGVNIFGLMTAGVATAPATSGTAVGFAGSGGVLLVHPLKNGWSIDIPIRVIASTVGPPQYVMGVGVGWGK